MIGNKKNLWSLLKARGVCLSVALFLAACGSGESKDSKKDAPPSPKTEEGDQTEQQPTETLPGEKPKNGKITPVLVFFGGYTSCVDSSRGPDNMDLTDMFTKIQAEIKEAAGNQPAFFLSCYALDPNTATYINSDNKTKKRKSVSTMEKDLAAFVKNQSNPVVLMAGHSYGAYTALKLLPGLDKAISVKALATFDAISKIGCSPSAALPAVLGSGPAPKGCLEAPSDISTAEQVVIKSRVTTWINYYQTDSQILHSGPFEPAKNELRSYTSGGFAPHNDLVFDPEVIEEVAKAMKEAFQKN